MKKIFALILALALIVCLCAACGSEKGADTSESSVQETDGSKSLSEKKVLTMATNATFPPYEYHEGDKIVGIDAEIAAAIAENLGMELEIADIEFDSIIAGVQSGKYDMGVAGMTVTEDRLKNVNFSDTYAQGVQVIIVREGSNIKSADDLEAGGLKIGVQTNTTGDIYATDDFESKGDEIVRYNKGTDAVAALVSEKIDCVIIDNEPAKAFIAANDGLKILDTEYVVEDYAICIAKDNTELLEKVNETISELKESGALQEIIDKYITAE